MQISILSELFYPYLSGGAEKCMYEIAKRLAKRHDVDVYSMNLIGQPSKQVHENMRIFRIGARHPLSQRYLPFLATYNPFFKVLRGNYDIVHANQGTACMFGAFKYVTKRPFVATFHDIYWNDWNRYYSWPYNYIGKSMEFTFSKLKYNTLIANSEQTKGKLEKLGFSSPIKVIPNGVDLDVTDRIKAKKNRNSILYVGRLVSYKNVDTLIKAFALVNKKLPDATLIIIGTGPERKNLEKLAANLECNVKFLGFVSEEKKLVEIKSAEILVNPSDIEGFGIILLEAMACRCPIIAQPLRCYNFCNSKNSILAPNIRLSENIIKLLDNRRLRQTISSAGYETAKSYSWERISEKVEAVYEEVGQHRKK